MLNSMPLLISSCFRELTQRFGCLFSLSTSLNTDMYFRTGTPNCAFVQLMYFFVSPEAVIAVDLQIGPVGDVYLPVADVPAPRVHLHVRHLAVGEAEQYAVYLLNWYRDIYARLYYGSEYEHFRRL